MRDERDFATIEEALEDMKAGRMVVVVDDEDRENEGDLTIAAQFVTPEAINFMAAHGRGLIWLSPMSGAAPVASYDSRQPVAVRHLHRPIEARGCHRSRPPTALTPSRWLSIRPVQLRTWCGLVTYSLWWHGPAACWPGRDRPRRLWTWPGWPGSFRPGLSARS